MKRTSLFFLFLLFSLSPSYGGEKEVFPLSDALRSVKLTNLFGGKNHVFGGLEIWQPIEEVEPQLTDLEQGSYLEGVCSGWGTRICKQILGMTDSAAVSFEYLRRSRESLARARERFPEYDSVVGRFSSSIEQIANNYEITGDVGTVLSIDMEFSRTETNYVLTFKGYLGYSGEEHSILTYQGSYDWPAPLVDASFDINRQVTELVLDFFNKMSFTASIKG